MSGSDAHSNVTPLRVRAARKQSPASDDTSALSAVLSRLLADADPDQPPSHPEPPGLPVGVESPAAAAGTPDQGPEPFHRNAIACPQCDRWAWRATETCWNCSYNIFAHAQREAHALQQQLDAWRRKRLSRCAFSLTAGGIAMLLLSSQAPHALGQFLAMGGLMVLLAAYVCVKMMDAR